MSKKDTAQFWDTAHRYLDHQLKVIRQVSSHTIDSYRDCLNSFINYLERIENVGRKRFLSITSRRNNKTLSNVDDHGTRPGSKNM